MKKVLIIDDDIVFRQTLGDMLKAEGLAIVEAGDGKEGLSVHEAEKPDLIMLDIEMPELDGIGFLKALRNDQNAKTPVLITSNRSGLDTISEGVALGVRGYIVKSAMPLSSIVEMVGSELAE